MNTRQRLTCKDLEETLESINYERRKGDYPELVLQKRNGNWALDMQADDYEITGAVECLVCGLTIREMDCYLAGWARGMQ